MMDFDILPEQILSKVAQRRLEQYRSQYKAAESLGIDVRTLRKYATYEESDDWELGAGERSLQSEASFFEIVFRKS